jgi:hypothetical protein
MNLECHRRDNIPEHVYLRPRRVTLPEAPEASGIFDLAKLK